MINKFIILLLTLHVFYGVSQTESAYVLGYHDFIQLVANEHPYAKQADIRIAEGNATLLYAKGAFDPEIYTDINQKYYKENQYYSLINSGLRIPTWFGIELKGGYEQNQGIYLNSSNSTPSNGLLYAGISLPIGQGLLIDKRRAELKKAQLFQQVSQLERQIIINELIYTSGTAYWKWFKSYNTMLVYQNTFNLAKERFEAVKFSAKMGGRPAIDTLEASIQMQNRLLRLLQSKVDFKNTSALLSIFLWDNGVIPLELADGAIPERINAPTQETNHPIFGQIDSLINNHPKITQSRYIINQLEIEKRLKKNQLLPVLKLKYNPITENLGGESFANYSINNYTWGVAFQMPIFLRKERGALKLVDLKIQDNNLQLSNKQEIVRYRAISAWNLWNASKEQINIYAQTVKDAKALLDGERQLFNVGESSLFMVNSREVGYIKTQLKYIELLTNNKNAELTTTYALGELR